MIQTDAAINPGLRGPLLDSSGPADRHQLRHLSPSGAYAGIGFAVPVDTVKPRGPQLIRKAIPPAGAGHRDRRAAESAHHTQAG